MNPFFSHVNTVRLLAPGMLRAAPAGVVQIESVDAGESGDAETYVSRYFFTFRILLHPRACVNCK